MTNRTLSLKKDTLTELTTDELTSVVGAQWTPGCPLFIRLSDLLECHGGAR